MNPYDLLQGTSPYLQGSSPDLQGSSPNLQPAAAGTIVQPSSPTIAGLLQPATNATGDIVTPGNGYVDPRLHAIALAISQQLAAQRAAQSASRGSASAQPVAPSPAQTAPAVDPASLWGTQMYGGQGYTNAHDYYQAQLKDATDMHNQAQTQAKKAYDQGLISYDQLQQAITLSRQNANTQLGDLANNYQQALGNYGTAHTGDLSNLSGYFSSISPFAYQSAQGNMEQKSNDLYKQQLSNAATQNTRSNDSLQQYLTQLTQQQGNLGTQRQNFVDQNTLNNQAQDKSFQQQKDTLTNNENAWNTQAQNLASQSQGQLQGYMDQSRAAMDSYRQYLANAQTQNAAGTQQANNAPNAPTNFNTAQSMGNPFTGSYGQPQATTPTAGAPGQSQGGAGGTNLGTQVNQPILSPYAPQTQGNVGSYMYGQFNPLNVSALASQVAGK